MNFEIVHKKNSNSDPDYRFGFNGMLRDDDVRDKNAPISAVEGRGNSYDFGARIYDPRTGRFLSLDPLKSSFLWQSPYLFAGNDPIIGVDVDGKWLGFVHYYILDNALKGVNPRLVSGLQSTSDYADEGVFQYQKFINQHLIMIPEQTKNEYIIWVKDFMIEKMNLFIENVNLTDLGMGLHTTMDLTFPVHRGVV